MNKEEFKKYFSQQLSDIERHQLEKAAQTDAFAYEAMEGFEQDGIYEADLKDLNERLQNRVFEKEKVRTLYWWKISGIAASIGIVLGLFGGWLLFGLKDEMKSIIVSQKVKTTVKEEAPSALQEVAKENAREVAPLAEKSNVKIELAPIAEEQSSAPPAADITIPTPNTDKAVEIEKVVVPSAIEKSRSEKNSISGNLNMASEPSIKGEISISSNKEVTERKIVKTESPKAEMDAVAKTKSIKAVPTEKKVSARTSTKVAEPTYKSAGEEISLGGLADILKQEQNETAKEKLSKADGIEAPIIVMEEQKKPEVYKYDYDKAQSAKKAKDASDGNSREKKSKIKIPLGVLPSNITFEDYVKIKLHEKVYRCPKKGSVKLFVNLDKNKKIEDFTILEVNNKVCVDFAKAILEEWLLDKADMYDENRAYQFIVNFN